MSHKPPRLPHSGSGRLKEGGYLAATKQDFNSHQTGTAFRHAADDIDMNPELPGIFQDPNVQGALEKIATHATTHGHNASEIIFSPFSWLTPSGNPSDVQAEIEKLASSIGAGALLTNPLDLSSNADPITTAPLIFRNCIFTAVGPGAAASIQNYARRVIFEHCVFIGAANSNYAVYLESSNVTLNNCVIFAPRGNGLRVLTCQGGIYNTLVQSGTDATETNPRFVRIQGFTSPNVQSFSVEHLSVFLDTGAVRPTGTASNACVEIGPEISVRGLNIYYDNTSLAGLHRAETLLIRGGSVAYDVTVDLNDLEPLEQGEKLAQFTTYPIVGLNGGSGVNTKVDNLLIMRAQLPSTDVAKTIFTIRTSVVNNLQIELDSTNDGYLDSLIALESSSVIDGCLLSVPHLKAERGYVAFLGAANRVNNMVSPTAELMSGDLTGSTGYINFIGAGHNVYQNSTWTTINVSNAHPWCVMAENSKFINNYGLAVGLPQLAIVTISTTALQSIVQGNQIHWDATSEPCVAQTAENSIVLGNIFYRTAGATPAVDTTGPSNIVTDSNITV